MYNHQTWTHHQIYLVPHISQTERERQTDRQTDRDRDRETETETETDRQTDRQTERQTETERQRERESERERERERMASTNRYISRLRETESTLTMCSRNSEPATGFTNP